MDSKGKSVHKSVGLTDSFRIHETG